MDLCKWRKKYHENDQQIRDSSNLFFNETKDTNEDSNKIKGYSGDSIRYPALTESDIDIAAPMKYYTWDIKAVQMNIISFRGDRWLLWMCLYNGDQGPALLTLKSFYLKAFSRKHGCDWLMLKHQPITATLSAKSF